MRSRLRAGFTLIELMVSMALTLLIMAILAQAFGVALETYAGFKAIGDMQQNLRTAAVLLRSDLENDHIEGKRRLSDPALASAPAFYPQAGFFAVKHGSVPPSPTYVNESKDQNGLTSFRATDHLFYCTVKRRGNRQQDFFTTGLQDTSVATTALSPTLNTFFSVNTAYNIAPGPLSSVTWNVPYPPPPPPPGLPPPPQNLGYYSSQWAEVLYYLVQTGSTEEPNNPASILGTPTFSLMRAQFVMVPDSTNLKNQIPNAALNIFQGMACNQDASGFLSFYSPTDAAQQGLRTIKLSTFNPLDPRLTAGSTLVLPNVVSFQVEIMRINSTGTTNDANFTLPNAPFTNLAKTGTSGELYDTTLFSAAAATYNNKYSLKAIQLTMRIWDYKTRQTRQSTLIIDL